MEPGKRTTPAALNKGGKSRNEVADIWARTCKRMVMIRERDDTAKGLNPAPQMYQAREILQR